MLNNEDGPLFPEAALLLILLCSEICAGEARGACKHTVTQAPAEAE